MSKKARRKDTSKSKPARAITPSAATIFRSRVVDVQSYELVRKMVSRLKPVLWIRDGKDVRQIEQAETPDELLDLAHLANGLGEFAWHDRVRSYGPEILPQISSRLSRPKSVQKNEGQVTALERLISELRWRGDSGAAVLVECFDSLDDYGKSLASVVLGLLSAKSGSDNIWGYYQKVKRNLYKTYFVGALWGLVDLNDPRAADALVKAIHEKRNFYELFGFLARAGDVQAILPLLVLSTKAEEEQRTDILMAIVAIAHRIGKDALITEIERVGAGQDKPEEFEKLAGTILSRPARYAEEHFALFYRGFNPEDVSGVLNRF